MYRALMTLSLAAGVAYGGYWAVGSAAVESSVNSALERMRASGQADYSEVSLAGFPSRFDLTISDPALRTSDGIAEWRAPFLQLLALSYRPNHLIVVWPHEQDVTIGPETISVTSEDMRANLDIEAGVALALDRTIFVSKAVGLASKAGWRLDLDEARFATQRASEDGLSHRAGIEILRATPSPDLRALIDPEGALPPTADWAKLDAVVGFDRPIDRFVTEAGGPRLTDIQVKEISFGWGELRLDGEGEVLVDADGVPEGRITFRAREWRKMVQLAVAAGALRAEIAPTIENGLERLAIAGGSEEVLALPLVFANGRMSLGPLPLGPAPRF